MKSIIKRKIFLTLVVFLIWLMLAGLEAYIILIGILCSILIVFIFGDINIQNEWTFKKPLRYLWFIPYAFLFTYEVIKANLDVAYRILMPNLPIRPGIVKIKTNLKSDAALTILANSITLTPGTLSVDVDKDNGYIYVHWIYVRSVEIEETTKKISAKFEKILEKIFN